MAYRALILTLCACASACAKPKPAPVDEAPPPSPIATTPPIWQPPDLDAAAPPPPPPPPSPDLLKARAAAEQKDWKKVRALLEKRARAGKAAPDEAQLAFDACVALKDKPCFDGVHAKYPDVTNH